ncbi:MAG: molybdopterin molybdotransferase MoeA [Planctomycetes bacterium]|nr:molybdopterin molybdotransferase MoeA [Planctomycetota bacterium]
MRTPEEAVSIILERATAAREREAVPLSEAAGRVLAREVLSDIDLPPFEKSAMDGYAVRSAEVSGESRLRRIGESRAGEPWTGPVGPGECVAIYTGGELPPDCDAVVMVEKSRRDGDHVVLTDDPEAGQHVCHRGEDIRAGECVLAPGRRLAARDLSLLASVGCDPVQVWRRPRVSILTTGDELVKPSEKPGPGQIREGNTLHLAAMVRAAGAEVRVCGVVPDDPLSLREAFAEALEKGDVLISTGGVSMGEYDFVGSALKECGVEEIFHKVAIKPGKPVWFGALFDKLVFGLPGNPVSCLVGHEVFVRPALAKLGGADEREQAPRITRARWCAAPPRAMDRQQNLPVELAPGSDGVPEARPVRWKGSADLVGLSRAGALAIVPANATFETGALVDLRPLG